jgi:superfamily II DNA helicase RecQ
MCYIVVTGALGTGIDVAGIGYIIHLGALYSIIDYTQETERARRTGEMAVANIIIEEHNWPGVKDEADDMYAEQDIREVNALIRTRGCRRLVLGEYLDGDW